MDVGFTVPGWLVERAASAAALLPAVEERMRLAIALSRENLARQTGGPFGAAVFDAEGRLIAAGANLVTSANCSMLHAEVVAIMLAQKRLGRYDLSDGGRTACELVTSTEPCVMCFGAVHWSGVTRLVCGARGCDAARAGFDEGPKPGRWWETLERRGVRVRRDVLRAEAAAVLDDYAARGGCIYNAGAGRARKAARSGRRGV